MQPFVINEFLVNEGKYLYTNSSVKHTEFKLL